MPQVEVCFAPEAYFLYQKKFDFEIVVVIDVLRATTTMITGLAHGVKSFIPVASLDDAFQYQILGYEVAAERNGQKISDFPLGNSPLDYLQAFQGKEIVLTTTNGTTAIDVAQKDNKKVFLGALVNLRALSEVLITQNKNVLLLCSGWKNKFNMEDTVCAGGILESLLNAGFFFTEDSSLASKYLFDSAKTNYKKIFRDSSHRKRLQNLGLEKDIRFCLTLNRYSMVPVLDHGKIVPFSYHV